MQGQDLGGGSQRESSKERDGPIWDKFGTAGWRIQVG